MMKEFIQFTGSQTINLNSMMCIKACLLNDIPHVPKENEQAHGDNM